MQAIQSLRAEHRHVAEAAQAQETMQGGCSQVTGTSSARMRGAQKVCSHAAHAKQQPRSYELTPFLCPVKMEEENSSDWNMYLDELMKVYNERKHRALKDPTVT